MSWESIWIVIELKGRFLIYNGINKWMVGFFFIQKKTET